ncbi:SO2930 family diheme c-type cytochrome [Qipengyuania sp. JC766]|uniref:SO2930 family diheme c-type cytochrome n=1 Tax=Qipengyuania sp. JC766 TaxID=3232139 RepID=UPI003458EDA6
MIGRGVFCLAVASFIAATGLARSPAPVNDDAVMEGTRRALSEYNFFTDLAGQQPNFEVTPYRLNMPLYSDGAEKLRFVFLPDGKSLAADGEGLLQFPVGSAIIKTFAFGEGADRRLIETRLLLHRADGWLALPYKWNEEQTDATLALAGARLEVERPGGDTISYRVPNKNQCKECHGLNGAVVPIGPKARNMAHGWLAQMVEAGALDRMPEGADTLPVWEDRADADAEQVARAYLDVNCAHCHRPAATASNSGLDLRWEQDGAIALGILKRPVAAGRGSGGHEFSILPGEPDRSIMVHRMDSVEPGVAMPELGKSTVDPDGVAAVRRWIEGMPAS